MTTALPLYRSSAATAVGGVAVSALSLVRSASVVAVSTAPAAATALPLHHSCASAMSVVVISNLLPFLLKLHYDAMQVILHSTLAHIAKSLSPLHCRSSLVSFDNRKIYRFFGDVKPP